jgi:hypothetical protein
VTEMSQRLNDLPTKCENGYRPNRATDPAAEDTMAMQLAVRGHCQRAIESASTSPGGPILMVAFIFLHVRWTSPTELSTFSTLSNRVSMGRVLSS